MAFKLLIASAAGVLLAFVIVGVAILHTDYEQSKPLEQAASLFVDAIKSGDIEAARKACNEWSYYQDKEIVGFCREQVQDIVQYDNKGLRRLRFRFVLYDKGKLFADKWVTIEPHPGFTVGNTLMYYPSIR